MIWPSNRIGSHEPVQRRPFPDRRSRPRVPRGSALGFGARLPALWFPYVLRDQKARRLSLPREGMPEGFQRYDQKRDGKQPYQTERLASGVLPYGLVQEGR